MKTMKLLTILTLCISLSACGGSNRKPTPATLDTTDTIKDYSYQIVKFEYKDKLEASQPGGSDIYFEPDDSSKFYMDLILKVSNQTDSSVSSSHLFEGTQFYLDHKPVNTTIYTESLDQTQFDSYGDISSHSKAYIHIVSSLNDEQKELPVVLDLIMSDRSNLLSIQPEQLMVKDSLIKSKKQISEDVLFQKAYISDELKPSNTESDYSYYHAKDGSMYLIAQFSVHTKNLLKVKDLLLMHAIIDEIDSYKAVNLLEIKDGTHFSSKGLIPENETVTVYSLVEIPEDYENLQCKVSLDGHTYLLDIKK